MPVRDIRRQRPRDPGRCRRDQQHQPAVGIYQVSDRRRSVGRRQRVSVAGGARQEGALQTLLRRQPHLRQARPHGGTLHPRSGDIAGRLVAQQLNSVISLI